MPFSYSVFYSLKLCRDVFQIRFIHATSETWELCVKMGRSTDRRVEINSWECTRVCGLCGLGSFRLSGTHFYQLIIYIANPASQHLLCMLVKTENST